MFIAIIFWVAVTILGFLFVNKWHVYADGDQGLRFWHNIVVAAAALGTIFLIVKVLGK